VKWRWRNIPVPEPHVIVLVLAITLHLLVPLRLFPSQWFGHVSGWPIVIVGVALVIWAVRTISDMDISKPTRIVSSGPYAFSRNPMYLAWTLINFGIVLILNTVWLVILLPAALLFTHFLTIPREERHLEEHFGEDYSGYKARTHRWL